GSGCSPSARAGSPPLPCAFVLRILHAGAVLAPDLIPTAARGRSRVGFHRRLLYFPSVLMLTWGVAGGPARSGASPPQNKEIVGPWLFASHSTVSAASAVWFSGP